jgi:L-fucose/D-arabinose isomerase
MGRIAVLSFSDGREAVSRDVVARVTSAEDALTAALREAGHEVRAGDEIITTSQAALAEARAVADWRPDLTIFHYSVWAFPHFSVIAARELESYAVLLFCGLDPAYPGMVGMLAAGGGLDQIGRRHSRVYGDAGDPAVVAALGVEAAGARAARSLRGLTFGRIGGRSMGMYTAVSSGAQWIDRFGVDVEEIDQWEVVRRSELVPAAKAEAGRKWLEEHANGVHYDGKQLTPELLERQVRSYYAMRELIDEWKLDFTGIKAQPELTDHFATMDVTEAFLNDPYDWDGPKETHVCATEADMDGALTMQLLKSLSGTPVLFADVRHYDAEHGVWDLCNSGQHATWFAERNDDPAENMRRVDLHPEGFYFPAGGASIRHIAAPGEFTFARLSRLDGEYRMQVLRGAVERFDHETNERLASASSYEWPHAFARLDIEPGAFLAAFASNHIHAVPGDHVETLRSTCGHLGVDFVALGASG